MFSHFVLMGSFLLNIRQSYSARSYTHDSIPIWQNECKIHWIIREKRIYLRCVSRLWCIMVLIYANQNVGASVIWFMMELYLRATRSHFESWANHFWGVRTVYMPQTFKSFVFFPFIIIIFPFLKLPDTRGRYFF